MTVSAKRLSVVAIAMPLSAGVLLLVGCADQFARSKNEFAGAVKQAGADSPVTASVVEDGTSEKGNPSMKTEVAMFGAGCFWGVEAEFQGVKGVTKTEVGYSGGSTKSPTYKDVCADGTGHAEVVRVEFDPSQVSYDKLLDVFWENHDPTQLNRQGPDHGSQYRSVVYFFSPEQEAAARASKEKLSKSGKFSRPVVTEITKAPDFWRAEEYHQQYLEKRGQKVCH